MGDNQVAEEYDVEKILNRRTINNQVHIFTLFHIFHTKFS